MTQLLDAAETAARLPYPALVAQLRAVLADASVQVPERLVQPLPGGGSLFVMPALDGRIAIAKLITFTPANAGTDRPPIQGDVVVFDVATGERALILDGPTVTARRTAAVSLLAAQTLARDPAGPLLIVGAGAQGRAHLEAFAQGLPLRQVFIASRSAASAMVLVAHAKDLGLQATVVHDPNEALADCPLVVTCTPANARGAEGAAAGRRLHRRGGRVHAAHGRTRPRAVPPLRGPGHRDRGHAGGRARSRRPAAGRAGRGHLPHAARDPAAARPPTPQGPVLFKSCGWAGWDLAAARTAVASRSR